MFFAYILFSKKLGKYYTGSAEIIDKRLKRHNNGQVKFISRGRPWILVYKEQFSTRSEAYKRERELKSYKGGVKFKKLLGLI